jgi:hypothetical protein
MKKVALVLVLILVSLQSFSQAVRDRAFYEQKIVRYNKLKNAGIALTIGGAVLTVVGVAVLANTSFETDYNGEPTDTGNLYLGAYSLGFGMTAMGAGIPITIIGSNKKKQYQRNLKSLSFRLNAKPNNTGLVLTYKF